jgi:hypothetical protein
VIAAPDTNLLELIEHAFEVAFVDAHTGVRHLHGHREAPTGIASVARRTSMQPSGVNFTALPIRLWITWRMRSASPVLQAEEYLAPPRDPKHLRVLTLLQWWPLANAACRTPCHQAPARHH